jgi:hypothetical protein
MGQATSALIGNKVAARGFAANDPRFSTTVNGVGAVVTSIAGGLAVGASWPALLAAAGVSAVATVAAPLLIGKAIDWLWGSGDEAKIDGPDLNTNVDQVSMPGAWPDVWADIGAGNVKWYWNNSTGKWRKTWAFRMAPRAMDWPLCIQAPGSNQTKAGNCPDPVNGYWSREWVGYIDESVARGVYEWIPPSGQSITPNYESAMKPTKDIVADLPQELTSAYVSDEMLAAAANAQWKAASVQPGYEGLPWDSLNPITPQDVAQWRAINPEAAPTLNDYISPAINPETNQVEVTTPGSNPNTSTPGASSPQLNLGPDPGITAPNLEEAPSDLFAPIKALLQPWLNWTVPTHSSECPTWYATPNVGGYAFALDISYHCTVADEHRSLIMAAALAAWLVLAAFIVLSA